jgi:tetratricopeptide (TPR) repeat protein
MFAYTQQTSNSSRIIATLILVLAGLQSIADEPALSAAASNYQDAMDSGLYAEAEAAAKQRLDRALREGRWEDISTAGLLADLALAQRLNGDYEAALQNYEQAVSIVESNADRLDLSLIEPLLGIGKTHAANGRPDRALPFLERALHVRHVNAGPHSLEQAETLETLADTYRSMGQMDDAIEVADRLVVLFSRNFPGESIEIVPALLRKGQLHGEAQNWREERNAYNDAVKIVERSDGKSSVNLVRPLISYGQSHQREYFYLFLKAESEAELPDPRLLHEARTYFESAMELANGAEAGEWRIRSEALLAMGDFLTLTREHGRARIFYRDAWELLTVDLSRLDERRRQLEAVVALSQPTPDLTIALPFDAKDNSSIAAFETGFIVTQFTITRRGRVTDIGLVEIAPDRNDKIEAEVKQRLGQSVFRPRFEGGFAVDTPGQIVRYEFPYLISGSEFD